MNRPVLLTGLALLVVSGCLSGSYDEDFRSSVQRYREAGDFQRLRPEPHKLAADRLTLQVPKLFEAEDETGAEPWTKPPFLQDFPGFRVAFKKSEKVAEVELPFVFSVGALTDNKSNPDEIKKRILAQVQKESAFAKASWATREVKALASKSLEWSVLKLSGQQPFERVNAGNTETKNTPGETQIWVASNPQRKVTAVLVWRLPEELAASIPLEDLANLVARTVEFKEAPEPAAAPDAAAGAPPAGFIATSAALPKRPAGP